MKAPLPVGSADNVRSSVASQLVFMYNVRYILMTTFFTPLA